ncbi:tRNA synthetases class I-domain-containing protein [Pelagophyceae sp. CCMP2097]|nr:tRNA synthetases class I-domain-containing protein [Pelagophyceae sp. CCMP2097]
MPSLRHLTAFLLMRAARPLLNRARLPQLVGKHARALAIGRNAAEDNDMYRDTVLLPVTDFSQRANCVEREPFVQQWWDAQETYSKLAAKAEGSVFTLHDGPPYANGDLHIGHALNKVLKDFINRHRMLRGDRVRYVPGWDCHGLPIELKVLTTMAADAKKKKVPVERLEPLALRQRAAAFARETVVKQKAAFKSFGVWGDWETPYLTLQPEYEAAQLGVFAKMFERGFIYRGLKPVWYSPSSRTALAEAELEYPDGHTSPSAFVGFDVVDRAPCLSTIQGRIELAVWTTTPWTLPANLAVAVNENLDYVVVEAFAAADAEDHNMAGRKFIVAAALADSLAKKFGVTLSTVATFKGSELAAGTTYTRPIANCMPALARVVVGGDYITSEGGTGLVHTAPGHGMDDYQTGVKYGLEPFSPVDGEGKFTAEAGDGLAGLSVMNGDGGTEVEKRLGASLLLSEKYAHRYPYDWRTKKPVIQRATSQWFASVSGFRDEALKAIDEVQWLPAVGKNRISAMTEKRGDWCISRQRSWGVPLPVFYRKSDGEPVVTAETLKHVEAIVREHGSDAWFSMTVSELLPPGPLRDEADLYERGADTMDVWFDSGTSWAGVVSARGELEYPADLYLEGSDQHRGWFQSSLLTSIAASGKAPYKAVLTHGFVLDEKGFKMSKSLGNVVDPKQILSGGTNLKKDPAYGADVMRLWVSSVDYSSDVRLGPNTLKQVFEQYRKIRNTMRYIVGNVYDVPSGAEGAFDARASYETLPSVDKWLLGRLGGLELEMGEAMETYQFSRAMNALVNFCTADLSSFYLDVAKDRLYIPAATAARRVQCQAVLAQCLETLPRLFAPILPHLAEELWQAIPYKAGVAYDGARGSVFELPTAWDSKVDAQKLAPFPPHDEAAWALVGQLRDDANRALELARQDKVVGASLDAEVVVSPPAGAAEAEAFWAVFRSLEAPAEFAPHVSIAEFDATAANDVDQLRSLLLVSQVRFVADAAAVAAECGTYVVAAGSALGATVGVKQAPTARCDRCWYHDVTVGRSLKHKGLCARCDDAVKDVDFAAKMPAEASA